MGVYGPLLLSLLFLFLLSPIYSSYTSIFVYLPTCISHFIALYYRYENLKHFQNFFARKFFLLQNHAIALTYILHMHTSLLLLFFSSFIFMNIAVGKKDMKLGIMAGMLVLLFVCTAIVVLLINFLVVLF
jgi:hypothetical protein